MLKSLATPDVKSRVRIVSLIAVTLLVLSCSLFVTSAQEQQGNQQIRPRRVGSDAQQQKPDGKAKASQTETPEGQEVDEGDVVRRHL